LMIAGEPGLGKSRLIEEFMAGCAIHRTPGGDHGRAVIASD
jgi:predicted ATPase